MLSGCSVRITRYWQIGNPVALLLALIGSSSAAFAADPLAGKWKQNAQMSGGGIHTDLTPAPMLEIEVNGENQALIRTDGNRFFGGKPSKPHRETSVSCYADPGSGAEMESLDDCPLAP